MSTQRQSSIPAYMLTHAKQRTGYLLAGKAFASKNDVVAAIRKILWGYALGEIITPEDETLLLALLQHHPHAAEKIGVGIKRIRIQQNPVFPNQRGFFIERMDGTRIDFSYRECIHPSSCLQQVNYALRRSIEPQIIERKMRAFGGRDVIQCPMTDKRCKWDEMHVDHRPPLTFAQLSKDFLTSKHLSPEDVLLVDTPDGIGKVLGDLFLETEWQEYHRMFADLWVISITAHVEITRKRVGMKEV